MKTIELMIGIEKLDYVLPEFQREYVWTREKSKQLFVSLFRDYPTGALLLWKTDNPPEIKNNAVDRTRIGSTHVILDGQQRLTTLFLLTKNAIPPYYTDNDIEYDPRNLYFNLLDGDMQYYQKMKMEKISHWLPVTECFLNTEINVFEIAQNMSSESQEQFKLAQKMNANLTRLRNILEKIHPVQFVPTSANIDDAIDVFDRVNSQGTKLTDAELALTHICGKWPQARQEMKKYIGDLEQNFFYFELSFMIRALTAIVKGRGLFETIHDATQEEAKEGWKKLKKITNYLTGILPKHAFIGSTEDLNTPLVLIPLVAYLAKHEKFENEKIMKQAIHWLYAAGTWARYTAQTDQRLDHDIGLVNRHDNPWPQLVSALVDQRGRIEMTPSDLEGRWIGHPFYKMAYIMIKSRGGIDWCNGHPLDIKQSGEYQIHSHHIFPQSRLYKEGGYEPENHLHKILVNEIANRAFLTADSNWTLSSDLPEKYLAEVQEKFPTALEKQFIPVNSELWKLENYEEFLKQRRKLIADAFNDLMKGLITEAEEIEKYSAKELIASGETGMVEFKSSLRWDTRQKKVNKELEKVVAKTVSGFLNTDGGTLLIGVADDKSVVGIEDDINSIGKKDLDGFQQTLAQVLVNYIGEYATSCSKIKFEKVNDNTICIINVEKSQQPIYLRDGQTKEFYIRIGSSTRPLNIEEATKYIADNWG